MNSDKLTFDVVRALIQRDEKYLVCKRMEEDRFSSLWEFPGGKVEKGEKKQDALKRELKEELDIEIEVGNLVTTFEDEIPEMKIKVYIYNALIIKGVPRCIECQDLRWASLDQMHGLSFAPADRKIFLYLLNRKNKAKNKYYEEKDTSREGEKTR